MTWLKIDDKFPEHRRIRQLSRQDCWSNLNIAHPACNLAKGSRLLEEIGLA